MKIYHKRHKTSAFRRWDIKRPNAHRKPGRRFFAVIRNEFVRDAQAYFGDTLSDDIDINDEEHECNWDSISGDVLVLDRGR